MQTDFAPGDAVVLDGLQAKPSLNGRGGTLLSFADGRWGVDLAEEKIRVRPVNLRARLQPTTVPHEHMAASLRERHYAVCDGFLALEHASALHSLLGSLRESMDAGDVAGGRAAAAYARIIKQAAPRGDLMRFLTAEDVAEQPAFAPVLTALDDAVGALQASPLLATDLPPATSPLRRDEMQVTCYPGGGSRYVRHVDNNANNGRRLTCILYSNPAWTPADGGALRLYVHDSHVVDVAPLMNRCVVFWSDSRVPHEVLPSYADRYALSIWYCGPSAAEAPAELQSEKRARPSCESSQESSNEGIGGSMAAPLHAGQSDREPAMPIDVSEAAHAMRPRVHVHIKLGGCNRCGLPRSAADAPSHVVSWYQQKAASGSKWLCAACRADVPAACRAYREMTGFVGLSLTAAARAYWAADGDEGLVWMCCRAEGVDVDGADEQDVAALLTVAKAALARGLSAHDEGLSGLADEDVDDDITLTWDGGESEFGPNFGDRIAESSL